MGKVPLPGQGEKLTLADARGAQRRPAAGRGDEAAGRGEGPDGHHPARALERRLGPRLEHDRRALEGHGQPVRARRWPASSSPTSTASPKDDSGRIYVEVRGDSPLAAELKGLFKDYPILGLKAEAGIPDAPDGPAVACTIDLGAGRREGGPGRRQVDRRPRPGVGRLGQVHRPGRHQGRQGRGPDPGRRRGRGRPGPPGRRQAGQGRRRSRARTPTRSAIDNYSPLILNGLALAGTGEKADESLKLLSGIAIAPRKSFTIPATAEVVEALGLKNGVRVLAADLSGL